GAIMMRLHYRHDTEVVPSTPSGKFLVHRKQYLPLGGVKNLLMEGSSGSTSYWSHAETDNDNDGDSTPGFGEFQLDLNDGVLQVFKCTGDQLAAYVNAWDSGKNGGNGLGVQSFSMHIPMDPHGGGKVGLPWGVPFTVRTVLTADANPTDTQLIGWELHKPNPDDKNGTLGLKYMPRYVKQNANLASGVTERPFDITTGKNLVAGLCLPMRTAAQGISRIQLFTPADGRILELKRKQIFESQARFQNISLYQEAVGEFFFRFPEPWVLPTGSKLLIDIGTDGSAALEITPLELVALESAGAVD